MKAIVNISLPVTISVSETINIGPNERHSTFRASAELDGRDLRLGGECSYLFSTKRAAIAAAKREVRKFAARVRELTPPVI